MRISLPDNSTAGNRRLLSPDERANRSAFTKTGRPRKPITCQFTVLIDNQEGAPYTFTGLDAGSKRSYRPLIVPTKIVSLKTGDYSIEGFEDQIAIERKELSDLFGSLGGKGGVRRERLEREHERMRDMIVWGGFAALVIEGSLDQAMEDPPYWSRTSPESILGTMVSWQARYGVHWHWCGTRRWAEILTFRILERAWRKATEARELEVHDKGE